MYNGEKYLEAALESLLTQTFDDLEVVIADNASTDGTEEICRAAAARDSRVRYVRHPENLGAAANHNVLLDLAAGRYFAWAAHDDLHEPKFTELCAEVLDDDPSVVGAYPRTRLIDERSSDLGEYTDARPPDAGTPSARLAQILLVPRFNSVLRYCLPVYGLFRADDIRRGPLIGPFNSSDKAFILDAALRGRVVEVDEVLFANRKHGESSLAGRNTAEVAAWFDPKQGDRRPLVQGRLARAYLSSVLRVPMAASERTRCLEVYGRWLARDRNWRIIVGEARKGTKAWIRDRRQGHASR